MNISVILPAAGLGRRFAAGEQNAASKIEYELWHRPVFLRAIALFRDTAFTDATIGQLLLAVPPDQLEDFRFRWGDQLVMGGLGVEGPRVTLIPGGEADRWETVKLALEHVNESATHVAVHDAARPCASGAMIERVFAAAKVHGAAVPGVAMGDTVKRVEPEGAREKIEARGGDALDDLLVMTTNPTHVIGKISETVDRAGLYRVQTPQVFEKALLVEAYEELNTENAGGITDDASVMERAGHDVYVVEGDPLNLKLTLPEDVEVMEAVLRIREEKNAKDAAVKQLFGDDDDE